VYELTVFYAV